MMLMLREANVRSLSEAVQSEIFEGADEQRHLMTSAAMTTKIPDKQRKHSHRTRVRKCQVN